MERRYFYQDTEHRVSLRGAAASPHPSVDGQPVEATLRPGPDGEVLVRFGAVTYRALVSVAADHTDVCVDGHHFRLQHQAPARARALADGPAGGRLSSPMTGKIRRVLVSEGQHIEAGTTLLLVEAMKMEFPVRAAGSGTVRRIHLAEGAQVEMGAPLVDLEADV
jgi:biotin carboxyl carrier protein